MSEQIHSNYMNDPYFKKLLNYNFCEDYNNYQNVISTGNSDIVKNVEEVKAQKLENDEYLEKYEFYKEKNWYITPEQEQEIERYEMYLKMEEECSEENYNYKDDYDSNGSDYEY